jgi:hypothetical protein
MPRQILRTFTCVLAVTTAVLGVPAAGAATSVPTPSKFTQVSAVSGPLACELTVRWKQDGKNTTDHELGTALSLFSTTTSSLPRVGRHPRVCTVMANQRSSVLTAEQVREGGCGRRIGNSHRTWCGPTWLNLAQGIERTRCHRDRRARTSDPIHKRFGVTIRRDSH